MGYPTKTEFTYFLIPLCMFLVSFAFLKSLTNLSDGELVLTSLIVTGFASGLGKAFLYVLHDTRGGR